MNFLPMRLFVSILLITMSCSDDVELEAKNMTQELLIGEWLVLTEHDYFCNSETIANERFAENDLIVRYNEDGTYESFLDGQPWEAEDQNGTWESTSNDSYRLFYTVNGSSRSEDVVIDFVGNETMNFGINSPCFMSNGEDLYTFSTWTRQ